MHPPNSTDSSLSSTLFETSVDETVDVSYRGSGRVDEEPTSDETEGYSAIAPGSTGVSRTYVESELYNNTSDSEDIISHRGSGRIRPFSL